MLSRTIVDLDFVALPKKKPFSSINQIEKMFDEWKKRQWAEHTTVEFEYDYETEISFQFNTSNIKEKTTIQKDPTTGFTYTQRENKKPSKDDYL